MLDLLKRYNYTPPKIVPGKFGNVEVKEESNLVVLYVNNEPWMMYHPHGQQDAFELFSHYYFADGHVVCTGMGFGIRENWILTKENVSKLTIVEKNLDVIKYHEQIESSFLKDERVEVLHLDAKDYTGECDVLLLDHYELQSFDEVLQDVQQTLLRVKCKAHWFWSFERIIMNTRLWIVQNYGEMHTKYDAFKFLCIKNALYPIPEIDEQTLNLFCFMYNSTYFSNSEWHLTHKFNDVNLFSNVYRMI